MTLSQTGVHSGTPTVLGQYNFQVTATGAACPTSVSYALKVQSVAAPIVTKLVRYGYHVQPTTLVASFSRFKRRQLRSDIGWCGWPSWHTRRQEHSDASALPAGHHGTPTSGLQNTGGVFLGGQGVGAPGTNFVQIFSGKILAGPNLLLKSSKVKSAK